MTCLHRVDKDLLFLCVARATAAKEVQKAFKTVKENVTESSSRRLVACESCGQQTAAESIYCTKCGKKLQ